MKAITTGERAALYMCSERHLSSCDDGSSYKVCIHVSVTKCVVGVPVTKFVKVVAVTKLVRR